MLLCQMPPAQGVYLIRILKVSNRLVAYPESQSKLRLSQPSAVHQLYLFFCHLEQMGKWRKEPELDHLWKRLTHLCDSFETWSMAPAARCSPPTLKRCRPLFIERQRNKYFFKDDREVNDGKQQTWRIRMRGSSLCLLHLMKDTSMY